MLILYSSANWLCMSKNFFECDYCYTSLQNILTSVLCVFLFCCTFCYFIADCLLNEIAIQKHTEWLCVELSLISLHVIQALVLVTLHTMSAHVCCVSLLFSTFRRQQTVHCVQFTVQQCSRRFMSFHRLGFTIVMNLLR